MRYGTSPGWKPSQRSSGMPLQWTRSHTSSSWSFKLINGTIYRRPSHQLHRIGTGVVPIMLQGYGLEDFSRWVDFISTSYPIMFMPENPFALSRLRSEVPIWPSTSEVIVQVGYVGLLFCGSFCMRISIWPTIWLNYVTDLNRDRVNGESFGLETLDRFQKIGSICANSMIYMVGVKRKTVTHRC